jgi:exosortase/archaeosortase
MDMIDVLIRFIIPALGALITYYIVPILKRKNLMEYITIGVYAAEQIFGADAGSEKFAYVKNWVKGKFRITDDELSNLIEAVVLQMNSAIGAGKKG